MFYSHSLLRRRDRFGLVWRAIYGRPELTRREYNSINVGEKCADVIDIINNTAKNPGHPKPAGKKSDWSYDMDSSMSSSHSDAERKGGKDKKSNKRKQNDKDGKDKIKPAAGELHEPKERASLWLQSHLLYGIIKVYSRQIHFLLAELSDVKVRFTMASVSIDLPREQKRGKDPRSRTTLDLSLPLLISEISDIQINQDDLLLDYWGAGGSVVEPHLGPPRYLQIIEPPPLAISTTDPNNGGLGPALDPNILVDPDSNLYRSPVRPQRQIDQRNSLHAPQQTPPPVHPPRTGNSPNLPPGEAPRSPPKVASPGLPGAQPPLPSPRAMTPPPQQGPPHVPPPPAAHTPRRAPRRVEIALTQKFIKYCIAHSSPTRRQSPPPASPLRWVTGPPLSGDDKIRRLKPPDRRTRPEPSSPDTFTAPSGKRANNGSQPSSPRQGQLNLPGAPQTPVQVQISPGSPSRQGQPYSPAPPGPQQPISPTGGQLPHLPSLSTSPRRNKKPRPDQRPVSAEPAEQPRQGSSSTPGPRPPTAPINTNPPSLGHGSASGLRPWSGNISEPSLVQTPFRPGTVTPLPTDLISLPRIAEVPLTPPPPGPFARPCPRMIEIIDNLTLTAEAKKNMTFEDICPLTNDRHKAAHMFNCLLVGVRKKLWQVEQEAEINGYAPINVLIGARIKGLK